MSRAALICISKMKLQLNFKKDCQTWYAGVVKKIYANEEDKDLKQIASKVICNDFFW